jgi:hypothetical protein
MMNTGASIPRAEQPPLSEGEVFATLFVELYFNSISLLKNPTIPQECAKPKWNGAPLLLVSADHFTI